MKERVLQFRCAILREDIKRLVAIRHLLPFTNYVSTITALKLRNKRPDAVFDSDSNYIRL